MDDITVDIAPAATEEALKQAPSSEAAQSSVAPPEPPLSTSALSSAPATDPLEASEPRESSLSELPQSIEETAPHSLTHSHLSAQTESIVKRINDNAASAAASGTPGYEAAREQVMRDMQTSDKFPTPSSPKDGTPSEAKAPSAADSSITLPKSNMDVDTAQVTPASTSGRGRGGGRPRGRGRGGGRGGKRKRERSDDESDDSEVYTPMVTTTKSGRSVQKPTSFVPPPVSPTSSNKRKRPYRKNPESAVCKICLRGTSPTNNMIVFCDGCNSPYHRYCHHPPIDQAVIDEVDKEWYCKQCEKERVAPVPESEIANFISAEGAPVEQRQRYFASLSPGMLVTLLTRATTLKPDLPVFAPDFQARISSTPMAAPPTTGPVQSSNGHAHPQSRPQQIAATNAPNVYAGRYSTQQSHAGPAHASQPQQQFMQAYPTPSYGPEVHPPNYPRPGQGMMRTLPPEQEDLQWLVDDGDKYGVYSHMYHVQTPMADSGLNGGVGQPQR